MNDFKHLSGPIKTLFVLILLMFLGGCESLGVRNQSEEAPQKVAPELTDELLYQLLVGEFAGNSGDLATSIDSYQQAAESSQDSRIAARATYIALYGKKYEQALEALERWQELAPEELDVNRMYAIAYIKLHQPQNAVPYIQKILNASEGSEQEKAIAVKTLLQKESDTQDGLLLLDALNLAQPDNLHMLILQARYAAQLELYEDAISLLDQVITIEPSRADVYIIKARILEAQGRRVESKAMMMMVLKEHPDDASLRLQYARMLVEDREFDAAREQFLILREQKPDNPEVLLSLALLYIETKQLDQATEYLEQLIEMGKKVDVANYYLGRIAQNKELHKIAIAYYLKVKNGVYVFEAKLRIAGLFARLGRSAEAIEQLETLADNTTSWPDKVRAYLARGEILRSLQRHKEAFQMYSRALRENPDDADLLYARALSAEKVDRLDITESDLLKVLSSEPENANALNALGYTLADRTGRLEEALDYIKRAAQLIPDDPAILDSLGWVSYRLGKMQDALKWLGKAFEKLEDAEIAAHYGEVLWKSNQRERAREVWEAGKKDNAEHPVLVETLNRLNP